MSVDSSADMVLRAGSRGPVRASVWILSTITVSQRGLVLERESISSQARSAGEGAGLECVACAGRGSGLHNRSMGREFIL